MSVFRQPPLERNALHEYLDNEDAAINTVNTATSSEGGYAMAQEGWGAAGQGGSNQGQKEDEDMEVGWLIQSPQPLTWPTMASNMTSNMASNMAQA